MNLERILPPRLVRWAPQFMMGFTAYGVDPLLTAAICDRESAGGDALNPKGPSGTGDLGHGLGLMQIDSRYHMAFAVAKGPEGVHIWKDPSFNVLYGCRIISFNLRLFPADLAAVVAAYNASWKRVRAVLLGLPDADEAEKLAALDRLTTGGNYASDVLGRRSRFMRNQLNGS